MNRLAITLAPVFWLSACGGDGPGMDGTGGSAAGGGSQATGGQSSSGGAASTTGGTTADGGGIANGGTGGATGGAGGATGGAGGATGGSGGATGGSGGVTGGSGGTTGGSGGNATGGTGGSANPTCPYTPPEDPDPFPQNWTSSEVTLFNDNGGWTWYNDERVVVDPDEGKIIVSSAASTASSEGANTEIHAVIHDLATGENDKMALGSLSYSDDHNNGGIVVKAPGEYYVAWAHHNVDCNTYWRNYADGSWGAQQTFQWNSEGCPWGPPEPPEQQSHVTYNNPWKLSAEGRIYNFIRSVDTSPNFLLSEDDGQTWEFGGRLTASPQQGYNAGYYKYWGNGVDRIDFFATEAHPRDANTSVFHGYIKDGKTYDSFDNEIDGNLFDPNAPEIKEFTTVFPATGTINGVTLNHLWNFDIARYEDGTIGVLWQGREGGGGKANTNPNHRILYSRFDGTEWTSTYLVRGGRTLYRDQSDWWEEDYLGGAALDPDDPHVIYVSTPIDPRDDTTTYDVHEIWKGVTCDEGASFEWTPLTMNSPNENLRPAVPKWDAQNTAVLWFRGNYQTAQRYSAEVVGIVSQEQ